MEAYIILFYLFLVLLVASFVFVMLDFLLYSLFGFNLTNFVFDLLRKQNTSKFKHTQKYGSQNTRIRKFSDEVPSVGIKPDYLCLDIEIFEPGRYVVSVDLKTSKILVNRNK